jgi:hypothetical protein
MSKSLVSLPTKMFFLARKASRGYLDIQERQFKQCTTRAVTTEISIVLNRMILKESTDFVEYYLLKKQRYPHFGGDSSVSEVTGWLGYMDIE